jgi:hypothetical protein
MGSTTPKSTEELTGGGESERLCPVRAQDPADVGRPGVIGHSLAVHQRAHRNVAILLHDVVRDVLTRESPKHHHKPSPSGQEGFFAYDS